jgi:outer membrane protein X
MKKVFRKVAIVAIALVTMSVAGGAQEKGDMAAGGNLVLGSGDSFTNYGIGAKFQYNVTDPLRLEGAFTYFLKKDYVTMWDLSVNGHWLFPVGNSASYFAFNLGGGLDYKLTDKLTGNVELKYKIADIWDRLLLSAGVAYRF